MFHYDISDATVSQVTLQHGVERHHKGLNSQKLFQICSRHMNKHIVVVKHFNYKFGSFECVKGHTMHPKWEAIPTSFIPPFRESKLSD